MTRRLSLALAALLVALALAGCGSDAPDNAPSSADGPWSYTSGNGEVVKLGDDLAGRLGRPGRPG
jgi:hypothetical protein